MANRGWKILDRSRAFDGFFKLDTVILQQQTPSGEWSSAYDREIFLRGDAVGLLPYDPVLDRIVLTEQFRAPLALALDDPWSVELPAGIIDPQESNEACGIRETFEETGCMATDLEMIADYFTSPGGSTERLILYCGKVDSTQAVEMAGEASENEFIRVFSVSFEEAMAHLSTHQFTNGMTVVALTWLKLNRDRLRESWGALGP